MILISHYFDELNKRLQHQVQPSSRHWHLDLNYMGGYIQHFKSCSTIYRSRRDKLFGLLFSMYIHYFLAFMQGRLKWHICVSTYLHLQPQARM